MAGPGRPRRFDETHERQLLLDASLAVMERNGFDDVSVADILAEADVSTRSFYRHFASKDELVCAIFRREAERAAERIGESTEAAETPIEALDNWLAGMLSIGHHHRKAKRAVILSSPGAMRAEGYGEAVRYALEMLAVPLRNTINAGLERGDFAYGSDEDIELIQFMVWAAAGMTPGRRPKPSFDQVFDNVRSFVHRTLGVQHATII